MSKNQLTSKFVDLSHPIEDGMRAYPGFPSPKIGAFLNHRDSAIRYEYKSEFYIGKVDMVCNVGTYLDAPFHRFEKEKDLSQIALENMAGLPGVVLNCNPKDRAIDLDLEIAGGIGGHAVLVRTGWDERWGKDDYWEPGPYISEYSIESLVRSKPALIGVDFWNIDDTKNPHRPAHTKLLQEGILIVEHLCSLSSLPSRGFRFFAIPPKIVKGASFPVRAFAEV